MSKFNDLPLCGTPLSAREAVKLDTLLSDLQRFLGSPGDWGYNTKLGDLTQAVFAVRHDVQKALEVKDAN